MLEMSTRSPFDARSTPLKVAVVAADPGVRSGLERSLSDRGVEPVGVDEAEAAVVLLGEGALPRMSIPVIALVDPSSRPDALIEAGAAAVLRRDVEPDRLCATLLAVGMGLVVVDGEMAREPKPAVDEDDPDRLSTRERQVLAEVAAGLSNREIAERLGISPHTAKFFVSSILSKLGAATRTEAVVLAARRGLLRL